MNAQAAPANGAALAQSAMDEVQRATGLRFVLDGPTDEVPVEHRSPLDHSRYGKRWSPVLVAWTDPTQVPGLAGPIVGIGGPGGAPYSSETEKHWVSGIVYLDAPGIAEVLARPNGMVAARAIVIHELGHLVGLDHVNDPSQLMYPHQIDQSTFGPGDLEGLRLLGDGPCFS
ncbi:matrixin family metalloprotease [Pedococcus bigeumensis]|uniref:matrixin family metalloprotease n=1 Tax=Pedococcus bigeumensis TaxID=433644 RepID=UPI0031D8C5C3